jgi:hypothetical protein
MIRLNSVSDMSFFKAFRKLPNGLDGFFLFKAGDRLDSSVSGKNRDKFANELMNCILTHINNKKSAIIISDLEIIKLIEMILEQSMAETKDYREYIYIIYDIDEAVNMNLFDKNQALIETGIYTEGKDFYYKDKLQFIQTTKYSGYDVSETIYEPYIEEESDTKMEAF